jgi:hypothetical protein
MTLTAGASAQENGSLRWEYWRHPVEYIHDQASVLLGYAGAVLDSEAPSEHPSENRRLALTALDAILHDTTLDGSDEFHAFVDARMEKLSRALGRKCGRGLEIYKVYNADIGGQTIPVKAESIQLDFEKLSDGSWKVTNGEVAGDEYNSSLDYYALDTVFSNAGGAYISSNMGIDFDKASNAASDYITDVIHRERAFYTLWERTDKLPENYEHITDDYVKDNNWLKFTYREAFTHDGPDVDIFTDSNGTIFAVAER